MATYAIGDVQGCLDELLALLERLDFDSANDRLWFTGDLVGRGPQSLNTLRFVHGLGAAATLVLGNHDLHCLAQAEGVKLPGRPDETLLEIFTAPDRDLLLDWLRRQPLLHHDPELGFGLIHAGLPPQWDRSTAQACAAEIQTALRTEDYQQFLAAMYGDEPGLWSDSLEGDQRLRFITNCFTRLRYCHADGRLALQDKRAPQSVKGKLLPWFAVPGRRSADTRWLFGHWSTLGQVGWEQYGVYGLDSGCLWGGALTALCLETAEITQLPCPGHRKPV